MKNNNGKTKSASSIIAEPTQQFGGDWTEVKLDLLKKYLEAYTTALKNQPFGKIYIDAFAGTGYREMEAKENSPGLFVEQSEAESEGFFDGSAKLALQIPNPFEKYIFVEKSQKNIEELRRVISSEFPTLLRRVEFEPGDANQVIPEICRKTDWRTNRAVLFLDPFGMSVDWQTMESIARTEAIDVWILFPVSVNRLLIGNLENIPQKWQDSLTRVFGTSEWRNIFYKKKIEATLFGDEQKIVKVPDPISAVVQFYQEQLRKIFKKVSNNPRFLCNSKNSPMFIFAFAIGNPKPAAQKLAIKIAEYILGKVKT